MLYWRNSLLQTCEATTTICEKLNKIRRAILAETPYVSKVFNVNI